MPPVGEFTTQLLNAQFVMALKYSYQKNPKRTANRNKSTIDGLLAGASMVGPLLSACRCVTLRASIALLHLLHPPRTFFLQGIIPATTHVTAIAVIILFKSNEKARTK